MQSQSILTTEPQEMEFLEDPVIELLREIVRQNDAIIQYLTREQAQYSVNSVGNANITDYATIADLEKVLS